MARRLVTRRGSSALSCAIAQRTSAVLVKGGPPTLLTESKLALDGAHFSPDGKWVVYETNETSAYEVWVASFPAFNQRRQVYS